MNNRGALLQDLGRLDEAESCYRECLNSRKQLLGKDHIDTLMTMCNLGILLKRLGVFEESSLLLQTTIDGYVKRKGARHPLTLATKNTMANLLKQQGNYPMAESLYEEVLRVRREQLGDNHTETLSSILNLAIFYTDHRRSKHDSAKEMLESVQHAHRVNEVPREHPDAISTMHWLRILNKNQEKWMLAEQNLREAFQKRTRVLGSSHPETLASMEALAVVLFEKSQGGDADEEAAMVQVEESVRLLRLVMDQRTTVHGPESSHTLLTKSNLARILGTLGDTVEAAALYKRLSEGVEKFSVRTIPRLCKPFTTVVFSLLLHLLLKVMLSLVLRCLRSRSLVS